MPSFTINVLGTGQEISHTLETSSTIGALKAAVNAQLTNPGNLAFDLFQNGQALRNESQSLSSAGVRHDQPILLIFNMGSTALQTSRLSAARQPRSGAATGDENEIERLRQATLSNNDAQARLRTEVPELHAALSDPARFREQFRLHRDRRQQEQQERSRMLSELEANPEDPDNQRKILDMIQQQNIEAQFNEVWEKYPELLARVTMLYIQLEVNGHPVKAFVDSGAQNTILSPSCADACNVTHLIDKRWRGTAIGVGTAEIYGKIHNAPVKIGYDELPCSFTVMEGKHVDMLLGLDMLKRYQACIDLGQNCLRFPGGQSVPFLPESEIPKRFGGLEDFTPEDTQDAAEASTGKSGDEPLAGQNSHSRPSDFTVPSTEQSSAPPPSASTVVETTGAPTAEYPQSSIDSLTALGANHEQALQALRLCEGNVEQAANIIFDLMG